MNSTRISSPSIWSQSNIYIYIYKAIFRLCEGGELFEKIIQHKTLDEQMVADIMQSLLSAVYYCHSKNVVHR